MIRRFIRRLLNRPADTPATPGAEPHAHPRPRPAPAGRPARGPGRVQHPAQTSRRPEPPPAAPHPPGHHPPGHHPRRPARRAASGPAGDEATRPPAATPPSHWDPASFEVPPLPGQTRFQDLDFPPALLHAIADLGFLYCTPIQALSLPPAFAGQDVAGQAQTGTGKTAAFLWTIFRRFLAVPPAGERPLGTPRALILAPTRELVVQIGKDAAALGRYCHFHSLAVYGGMGYDSQRNQLKAAPIDVVAATPGRLLDFARQRVLDLSRVEVLVLDEADRMLDMGFIPDVRRIIAQCPARERRQTLLFSATLSGDILRLANQWMVNPALVKAEPEQVEAASVEQVVWLVSSHEKTPLLVNLLRDPALARVLVFVNRRDAALRLTTSLERQRINCALLSGDVPQNKRLKILEGFRAGEIRVVVATDVAGRGLHIEQVSHVVNYDVPIEAEDYVHRIGRTGRAGAIGTAWTFACERESFTLPDIEKLLGHPLTYRQPTEEELRRLPTHPRT